MRGLSNQGQSWTLEPTRDYFVGSDRTCDINLSQYPDVASRHLRLSCDRVSNVWYVEDLGTTVGTYIDGEAISRSLIEQSVSIRLADYIVIVAEPASLSAPVSAATIVSATPVAAGRTYNTEEVRNPGFREVVREPVVGRSQDQYGGRNHALSNIRSREENSNESIKTIYLGSGRYSISSPIDGAGVELGGFSFSQTYSVERSKAKKICTQLYKNVLSAVQDGSIGDAKARLVQYRDIKKSSERTYILITHDTLYGARTTVFIRFLSYGDNLYLALDTYVLGKPEWESLVKRVLISALISLPIITAPFLILLWLKMIQRVKNESNLMLALRQEFPGGIVEGPFDLDDILMFAKSTIQRSITAVVDIFIEEEISTEALGKYAVTVNNVTVNNTNSGGGTFNMSGATTGVNNTK